MIQKINNKDQNLYHQQRFNPKLLPDLVNAGPVSASILFEARNPIKFLKGMRKKKTEDMQWGSMVDMLWLTPKDWENHFCELPEDAPKKPSIVQLNAKKPSQATIDAIAWWDIWNKNNIGKSVITKEVLYTVREARDMLDAHPIAREIWENSDKQTIFQGVIPEPCSVKNVQAKAMLDLLPRTGKIEIENKIYPLDDCIVDLKQCHNVSEYGMKNAIMQFEYHMKMAWYRRIVQAYEQKTRPHTILIFQNKYPPHDVHVRIIDPKDMEDGARLVQQRLDSLSKLDHRDIRPLFDLEVKTISLTKWMREEKNKEQ